MESASPNLPPNPIFRNTPASSNYVFPRACTGPSLHAKKEGISMNQYCLYLLNKNDVVYKDGADL